MFKIVGFIILTGSNPKPIDDRNGPYVLMEDCQERLTQLHQMVQVNPLLKTDGRCWRESWLI